jgi:signal transduction histidine kinase
VWSDRVQVQQVLMNLIMNSIDAMKNLETERDLWIETRRLPNDEVLVNVRDSGTGIPPDRIEEIFNAFYTTKSTGTGLGLRISRSIVELHGGKLWAANNNPRGAVFSFTLPVGSHASE